MHYDPQLKMKDIIKYKKEWKWKLKQHTEGERVRRDSESSESI